jgi:hypothetical protein
MFFNDSQYPQSGFPLQSPSYACNVLWKRILVCIMYNGYGSISVIRLDPSPFPIFFSSGLHIILNTFSSSLPTVHSVSYFVRDIIDYTLERKGGDAL